MKPALPSPVVCLALAVVMSGAQTVGVEGKAEADQSTQLDNQLEIGRQRLREPVKLPGPYQEAQRRLTQADQPVWWQSDAGRAEAVPPPWTPVVVDGPTVKVQ